MSEDKYLLALVILGWQDTPHLRERYENDAALRQTMDMVAVLRDRIQEGETTT